MRIYPQHAQNSEAGLNNSNMATNGEYLLLKNYLKPHQVIFDVGASIGEWSREILHLQPTAQLLAFEPLPEVFAELSKNCKCQTYNLALSDQEGKVDFFSYHSHSQLSGLFHRPIVDQLLHEPPQIISVEQTTLDFFCSAHRIEKIDFLKIDTEGAELKVLLGAQNLLNSHRIDAIQFEYGGTYLDAKITLREVLQLLTHHGYSVFRILPDGLMHISHWEDRLESMQYSNYFAVLLSEEGNWPIIDNL